MATDNPYPEPQTKRYTLCIGDKLQRIETELTIDEVLAKHCPPNVLWVFEGWPKFEGEGNGNSWHPGFKVIRRDTQPEH